MKKVAILGLGLMGASLGCALRKMVPGVHVTGYARRSATRDLALKSGVCDEVSERVGEAVEDADIVVVCVPVQKIPDLIDACRENLKEGSIVTDVGSTKAVIGAEIERLLTGTKAVYVGSHPVAGSELEGLEAAQEDLYDGAHVIVTRTGKTDEDSITRIRKLWQCLGATVHVMTAGEHDALLARTSHLPHILSAILVSTVARDEAEVGPFCGTGFVDTTRIADGSPTVWRDIVETNGDAILRELESAAEELGRFAELVRTEDFNGVEAFFEQTRTKRRHLLYRKSDVDEGGTS